MHYTPDRSIVRKVRHYDPLLFIKWNSDGEYFEVWRHCEKRDLLVTPVTQSIYFHGAPKRFIQLDERILWWLHSADSWSDPYGRLGLYIRDQRWLSFQKQLDAKRKQENLDRAKDIAFSTFSTKLNKLPRKNNAVESYNKRMRLLDKRQLNPNRFVRPDRQSIANSRVFYRSQQNAKRYFGK